MGYVDAAEEARRKSVLTRKPEVVWIKCIQAGNIGGVDIVEKDVDARTQAHLDQAKKRDLNPAVYGREVDTGYQVANDVHRVYADSLVDDLEKTGYKLIEVVRENYGQAGHRKSDLVLKFSKNGEAVDPPGEVRLFLRGHRAAHCTIFANWQFRNGIDAAGGQFRLDTINLKGLYKSSNPGLALETKGNTYVFIDAGNKKYLSAEIMAIQQKELEAQNAAAAKK